MNKTWIFCWIIVLCIACISSLLGQNSCALSLSGQVLDKETQEPLAYALVYQHDPYIQEETDSLGRFAINNLCPGSYHLEISHIGCTPEHFYLFLERDTQAVIYLAHFHELLQEVRVSDDRLRSSRSVQTALSTQRLRQAGSADLASITQQMPGVRAIANGTGMHKPMIHGQFGNRIGIIQDGVQLASQQWGITHAPEVDPQSAQYISIVKGAGALEYSGRNVSHLVIVDPGRLPTDDELAGELSYEYQTNGRRHTLNSRLERKENNWSWQWYGSYANGGDQKTSDYFLRNTGARQLSTSLRAGRELEARNASVSLSYNLYHSNVGILRGADVANTTDLNNALTRDVPFFTEDEFRRDIYSPRFLVTHQTLKALYRWQDRTSAHQSLQYSVQSNRRREYDVRRGGRSNQATLDLLKWTQDVKYTYARIRDNRSWKAGLNLRLEDNENVLGTGTIPLLPQYRSWRPAAFMTFLWEKSKAEYEIGARYSYVYTDVREIEVVPTRVVRYLHRFHEWALTLEGRWELTPQINQKVNLSFFQRSPEVNELHSRGIHQSVSSIEEGDPNMRTERTVKLVTESRIKLHNQLFITLTPHVSYTQDFLYLAPQDSLRLTVRGAYPVFKYEQVDALYYGGDAQLLLEPISGFKVIAGLSLLRSYDLQQKNTIVFTPGDRVTGRIEYESLDLPFGQKHTFSLDYVHQWEQTRIEAEQDFSPAPESYSLWSAAWTGTFDSSLGPLEASVVVENLLNTAYRDYLNRQRYFSDDLGRQISLRLRYRLPH